MSSYVLGDAEFDAVYTALTVWDRNPNAECPSHRALMLAIGPDKESDPTGVNYPRRITLALREMNRTAFAAGGDEEIEADGYSPSLRADVIKVLITPNGLPAAAGLFECLSSQCYTRETATTPLYTALGSLIRNIGYYYMREHPAFAFGWPDEREEVVA